MSNESLNLIKPCQLSYPLRGILLYICKSHSLPEYVRPNLDIYIFVQGRGNLNVWADLSENGQVLKWAFLPISRHEILSSVFHQFLVCFLTIKRFVLNTY